jgi:hypothetical protein
VHRLKRIFIPDTEFVKPDGETTRPVCACIYELYSETKYEIFFDGPKECPITWQDDDLVIGYNLAAEWGTFISAGWPLPLNCIDLYFEHLREMNGAKKLGFVQDPVLLAQSIKLTTALRLIGREDLVNIEKQEERDYIIANGVVPPEGVSVEAHRRRIVDYCWTDVYATMALIGPFLKLVDIDQALFRGAFSIPVAWFEHNGIPVDRVALSLVDEHREELILSLVRDVEAKHKYGVFKEDTTLSQKAFAALLERNGWDVGWPRTDSGAYARDDETMRDKAQTIKELEPLRHLLRSITRLRSSRVKVGSDGRSRASVWPLMQASGRCNPKGDCILGQAAWLRYLIKPPEGYALIAVDVIGEEFAIAAALSEDPVALDIYRTEKDQYLVHAHTAGYAPAGATKKTHPTERKIFKRVQLSTNYGVSGVGLSNQLRLNSPLKAELMIAAHHELFGTYWEYAERRIKQAYEDGSVESELGWRLWVGPKTKSTTILNFPQQSNGAEILRIASVFAVAKGLGPYLCYPHHDALYLCCPIEQADRVAEEVEDCFREAGNVVFDDILDLRCERKIVRYPDRYEDEDGEEMWQMVQQFLKERTESAEQQTGGDYERVA